MSEPMDVDANSPTPAPADAPAPAPTATKTAPNGVNGGSRKGSPLPPTPTDDTPLEMNGEAYKQAGNVFYKQKDYKKAVEQYTKAIELEPKNSTFLFNRSAAYMSWGRLEEALEDCRATDRLAPGQPRTLSRMARLYTQLGNPEEALKTFDRIHPPVSDAEKWPAVEMAGHIRAAQQALSEGTTGSMALIALEKAEKGLGHAVDIPRKWKLMKAEAQIKVGGANSLGEALNIAMVLLRRNQQDPEALVLRGKVLYAQGENDKAKQMFQEALRCDPDMKQARDYLKRTKLLEQKKEEGNTAFKKADYKAAKELYTEALAVDPTNKGTNSKLYSNRAIALLKVTIVLSELSNG
ncbi:TPR-like protein [Ascobolus immersus RN42]|uniref:TPR-like protein n=1 Tax=Ascobolus immersus RN42 TaxID=1160509 RepID=A0A3N4I9H4_ASCIM|nr:TPR-like protein [Ascobolus immersus RN42]